MNYYEDIKNKLIDNEVYEKVKDYSKERHKVMTYYEVGKLLSEAGKHYGKDIVGEYSKKLVNDVGKKYTYTFLSRMRQFYNMYSNVAPSAQLSWSHYVELLPMKDEDERNYYIDRCIKNHLSRDDLRRIKKEKEYERLSNETKTKLIENKELEILDEVKDPIIIRNSSNIDVNDIKERILKELILDDLDNFLRQLGEGYNYIYRCFVVVELKVTVLKKEHIGQVKENDEYIIRYSSDKRIKAIEYSMV